MKTPSKHSNVAAFMAATLWLLTGCETQKGFVSPATAEPISQAFHNGVQVSVYDARQVMCDRTTVPVYPAEARRNGLSGVAVVRVVVDETGDVIDSSVISSSPTEKFGRAALNAVRRWKFFPIAQADGHPHIYMVEQTISFDFDQHRSIDLPKMGGSWNGI